MKVFRIRGPDFTAGLVFNNDDVCIKASPILKEFARFSLWEIEARCFVKGWRLDEIQTSKEK